MSDYSLIAELHHAARKIESRDVDPDQTLQRLRHFATRISHTDAAEGLGQIHTDVVRGTIGTSPRRVAERLRIIARTLKEEVLKDFEGVEVRLGIISPDDYCSQSARDLSMFRNRLKRYGQLDAVEQLLSPIVAKLAGGELDDRQKLKQALKRFRSMIDAEEHLIQDEPDEDSVKTPRPPPPLAMPKPNAGAVLADVEDDDTGDTLEALEEEDSDSVGEQLLGFSEAPTQIRGPNGRSATIPLFDDLTEEPDTESRAPGFETDTDHDIIAGWMTQETVPPIHRRESVFERRVGRWYAVFGVIIASGLILFLFLLSEAYDRYKIYAVINQMEERKSVETEQELEMVAPVALEGEPGDVPVEKPTSFSDAVGLDEPEWLADAENEEFEKFLEVIGFGETDEPEPSTIPADGPKPTEPAEKPEPVVSAEPPTVKPVAERPAGPAVPCVGKWASTSGDMAIVSLDSGIWWFIGVEVGDNGRCVLAASGKPVPYSCLSDVRDEAPATDTCPERHRYN